MSKITNADRDAARDELRAILPPGSTVYTDVKHVSRSGMSRVIGLHVIVDDNVEDPHLIDISWLADRALGGWGFDSDRYGIKVGGAGMDMAFHLVYSLSRALYPDGHHCTGSDGSLTPSGRKRRAPRCPSNDHSNDYSALAHQYTREHEEESRAEHAPGLTPEERRAARVAYVSAQSEWIDAQWPKLWSKRRVHRDGGYALRKAAI